MAALQDNGPSHRFFLILQALPSLHPLEVMPIGRSSCGVLRAAGAVVVVGEMPTG